MAAIFNLADARADRFRRLGDAIRVGLIPPLEYQ